MTKVLVTNIIGPEGPEGPQGPPGEDGVVGADGPPGADGTPVALTDLTDVDTTGAVDGDFLCRVGGVWVPVDAPEGGGGGSLTVTKRPIGNMFSGLINPVLTNADTSSASYINLGGSPATITADFGGETAFEDIVWVLYYGDSRIYQAVRLEGSHDNSTWTDIRSAANFQPSTVGSAGLVISVNASWRYLRFTTNGSNTYPASNEWIEIYAPLEVVTDVSWAP